MSSGTCRPNNNKKIENYTICVYFYFNFVVFLRCFVLKCVRQCTQNKQAFTFHMNGTNIFVCFLFYNYFTSEHLPRSLSLQFSYTKQPIFYNISSKNFCIAYKCVFNITFALYFRIMHARKSFFLKPKPDTKTHMRHFRTTSRIEQ